MTQNKDKVFTVVSAPVEITEERVKNLLCSALEGGSNFWYSNLRIGKLAEGLEEKDFQEGGKIDPEGFWHLSVPLTPGCELELDASENDDDKFKTYVLNREKILEGLVLFAESNTYRHHWRDFIAENDDAITADVFLQFCIFGEVIFG